MPASEHQLQKKAEIINLIREGHKKICLIGSAGVGKTYLVNELINDIKRDRTLIKGYNNGMIYVTAPTHKALSVLKGKVTADVEFKTIHSALGLKLVTNAKTGARNFVPDRSSKNVQEFKRGKICFVDESSMLNTELLDMLMNDYSGLTVVFIGDSKQINPVGEQESPVFHRGLPTVELTEIVRQGAGNPIIDLSRDISRIFFRRPKITEEGNGYLYDNNLSQIISDLAEVNGTDELKYLAYTNDCVDGINEAVRKHRYGNPMKIEVAETIVFNSPYGNFFTNQEVKVQEADIITDFFEVPTQDTKFTRDGQKHGKTDQIKLRYYRVNDSFNVIHEDSEKVLHQTSRLIADCCAKQGWSWLGYYNFVEQFADIKYNHAITVHKSQGSTYRNAIVNVGNIDMNRNIEEKQRLFYTAVTRASNLLILNNVV